VTELEQAILKILTAAGSEPLSRTEIELQLHQGKTKTNMGKNTTARALKTLIENKLVERAEHAGRATVSKKYARYRLVHFVAVGATYAVWPFISMERLNGRAT
jgi:DNA-binding IclR family transcriptional regulator